MCRKITFLRRTENTVRPLLTETVFSLKRGGGGTLKTLLASRALGLKLYYALWKHGQVGTDRGKCFLKQYGVGTQIVFASFFE